MKNEDKPLADFQAEIQKVQTLANDGFRVAFDGGVMDADSFANLMKAKSLTGKVFRVVVYMEDY